MCDSSVVRRLEALDALDGRGDYVVDRSCGGGGLVVRDSEEGRDGEAVARDELESAGLKTQHLVVNRKVNSLTHEI